jgi:hypothetical protein
MSRFPHDRGDERFGRGRAAKLVEFQLDLVSRIEFSELQPFQVGAMKKEFPAVCGQNGSVSPIGIEAFDFTAQSHVEESSGI